jgi:DNA mismatch repair protein MutS2
MDERTLRVLEYDQIRQLLAQQASSGLGKERALSLEPSADRDIVRQRLKETSEARRALESFGALPLGGLSDIRPLLQRAAVGSVLAGLELLRVTDTLRCTRRMREYFDRHGDDLPRLAALSRQLSDHHDLEERIEATLDQEGEVVDDASPELVRLRRRARTLHGQLQERLQDTLTKLASGHWLQERLVTLRNGRYCIPIKAEFQRNFPGIIHDHSDSGATVFIEPQGIVEQGNDLRDTELSIEDEIRRILQELTEGVGQAADDLRRDLVTLGVLDFIAARGRLSRAHDGSEPELGRAGEVVLLSARHPLLDPRQCVPIDFEIGRGFATMLITGPNTGGKTVSLKTVGLLSLMAQSGLHIPADLGSVIPVFEQVFADIGDEQSIEQSLSTFSSHLTQIVAVLRQVGDRDLVLLDEIGAGTDPMEGSALARAILTELHARGARTVATTHYNDLKTFAYSQPGMENASVEFDVETLRPTYRLLIGQPGSSNAVDIAARLGLPDGIIAHARDLLGPGHVSVEEALGHVQESQRALERERDALAHRMDEVERLRVQYRSDLTDLQGEREKALQEGFEEAARTLRKAEEAATRIIADLQQQTRQSKVTQERREEIGRLREQLREEQARQQRETEARARLRPEPEPSPEPGERVPTSVQPGDKVIVPSLGRQGTVQKVMARDLAIVQVGAMKVEARVPDLRLPPPEQALELPTSVVKIQMEKAFTVAQEMNFLGRTVDETLPDLGKWIDDAFIAEISALRVVHGKGTGALRAGIHDFLRAHPQVRSFHLADWREGGEGVTIVEL